MNKIKFATLTCAFAVTLTGTAQTAFAALADSAESNNHISFEAGEDPTKPLNPRNPNDPKPSDPADPEDPTNSGTGNEGPLTVDFVSNIEFGTKKISADTTIYNAKNADPFVQVTDTRGTGAGWTLTAKASEFKSKDGTAILKGAELSFTDGELKTQTANISKAPKAFDVKFDNTDSKMILRADENTGRGTWLDVFNGKQGDNQKVQLKVLPGTAEANVDYTAKISWELTDAPM
ncbi:hypothetical protein MFLO_12071 [Listeria floridensis FSL S10-1187]|uniref:WxL domain-containing protein n=1 Tax=Listeria floridensis FSL S10-1187 TaxID=1265817 RepID=A0ABP3AX19_9LIST|nr:WxL domain-containing protein [Listeria floridensis]EUJ28482.1 hypothetical protein MFLO_12071 [Listeria floridensis FSL S10-1187]